MKKSTISALIFFIPLITIGSLMLVGFATGNQNQVPHPAPEAFDVQCQGFTISNGYYNISVSVDAMQSASIQKIIINPGNVEGEQANEEISGLSTYLNGTAVNMAQALNYPVRSGDYLQVNFKMPYTEAYPNQTIVIIQTIDSYGKYTTEMQGLNLTQTPSEPTHLKTG